MRVYCINCRWLRHKNFNYICTHPNNQRRETTNNWLGISGTTYTLKKPEELNKNNDCEMFEPRLGTKDKIVGRLTRINIIHSYGSLKGGIE